jgi:Domain of unknown function (DUF4864)
MRDIGTIIRAAAFAAMAAGAAVAVRAEDTAPSGAAGAIEGVIARQFDAFRADDVATAFTFASPMIQGMFGSPENFGAMVQNGYPMIWRPSDVEFRDLREERGMTIQRVRVRDASGKDFLFDYEMVEGPGGWVINGVYPVRNDDVAA